MTDPVWAAKEIQPIKPVQGNLDPLLVVAGGDVMLRGIDRVVPVGRALDMDIVWDGYDLIGSLSRLITY